nr:hypothetical protein [Jiangella asiatica]
MGSAADVREQHYGVEVQQGGRYPRLVLEDVQRRAGDAAYAYDTSGTRCRLW